MTNLSPATIKNRKYQKTWRERHPDQARAKKRKYYSSYYSRNRKRLSLRDKRARKEDPDRFKEKRLRSKFGISLSQYEKLLGSQGGVCAICKKPPGKKALAVDHDHITSKVRGLLCAACNQALGLFRDSVENLKKAILYLRKSS